MNEPVFHEKYGKGIAIKKRYLGFQQLIQFESGVEKWIKRHELKSIEEYDPGDDKAETTASEVVAEAIASEVLAETTASEVLA